MLNIYRQNILDDYTRSKDDLLEVSITSIYRLISLRGQYPECSIFSTALLLRFLHLYGSSLLAPQVAVC